MQKSPNYVPTCEHRLQLNPIFSFLKMAISFDLMGRTSGIAHGIFGISGF